MVRPRPRVVPSRPDPARFFVFFSPSPVEDGPQAAGSHSNDFKLKHHEEGGSVKSSPFRRGSTKRTYSLSTWKDFSPGEPRACGSKASNKSGGWVPLDHWRALSGVFCGPNKNPPPKKKSKKMIIQRPAGFFSWNLRNLVSVRLSWLWILYVLFIYFYKGPFGDQNSVGIHVHLLSLLRWVPY